MSKLIMDFRVTVRSEECSRITCDTGAAAIIPFDATVESALFTGKTLPGAADVQVTNAAGIRHMCAQYMFEGTDFNGEPCKLFVCNNGFFEPNSRPHTFHTCPTFLTNSEVLGEYLHKAAFRAEGISDDECLHIRIFDVQQDGPNAGGFDHKEDFS